MFQVGKKTLGMKYTEICPRHRNLSEVEQKTLQTFSFLVRGGDGVRGICTMYKLPDH